MKKFEAPILRLVTTADGPVCFDLTKEVEQVLKKEDMLNSAIAKITVLPTFHSVNVNAPANAWLHALANVPVNVRLPATVSVPANAKVKEICHALH